MIPETTFTVSSSDRSVWYFIENKTFLTQFHNIGVQVEIFTILNVYREDTRSQWVWSGNRLSVRIIYTRILNISCSLFKTFKTVTNLIGAYDLNTKLSVICFFSNWPNVFVGVLFLLLKNRNYKLFVNFVYFSKRFI